MSEREKQLKWSKIRVGLVVSIATLVLFLAVFFAGNIQNLFSPKVELRIRFHDIEGLRKGAPVWILGIEEGSVKAIDLDPAYGVRVTVSVNKKALEFIKRDSQATIMTMGLLGDKYVELSSGTPQAGPIQPGETIEGQVRPGIRNFVQTSSAMMGKLSEFVDKLDNLVASIQQGKGTLAKFINDPTVYDNLKKATDTVSKLTENVQNARGTLRLLIEDPSLYEKMLATASELEELSRIFNKSSGTLKKLFEDPSLYDKMVGTASEIQQFSRTLNESDGTIRRLLQDPSLYDRMLATATELQEISLKLKEGRGTLGRLLEDPELYENLNKDLKDLSSILERIDQGEGVAGALIKNQEMAKELEETITALKELLKDIKDNPKKYLRFSIF